MLKVGSDFSGVGAFDQALIRLGVDYETVFACDMDKFARQTYIHNYGEPKYYPENVYNRDIPKESLDIYMTSPPCQSFSLAGKRKGEDDYRGILFYNSHEFIKINKPRYFIFENVKGLLSDAGGKTFGRWIEYLGGKSVNGTANMFPSENSVPYHIYYRVLNAKNYNIPQNRERVFIIGIRDDEDNNFSWPKEEVLERRLKDVLESDVEEKYYLSEKMLELLTYGKTGSTEIANINKGGQKGSVVIEDGSHIGCLSATDYKLPKLVQVKSATKQGYELAEIGEDSINFEHPDSKTRRGRVGVGVGQTLTTSCNQGVAIGAIIGRNTDNQTSRVSGQPTQQMLEINNNGTSNALTTVQKDNVVVDDFRIRKLTPRECFRLMDFPDTLLDNVYINNIINSQGILLYLHNKTTYKWNVKEKIVTGKLLRKECASSIIRGLENMEIKILNSSIQTGETQNAQLKIAIEMFSLNKCAQAITTQIENGAILYLVKSNKVRLVKELDKELLNLTVSQDLEEKENQSIDLLLNVTLEESFLGLSMCTISTMILQITNYLTYTFSLHKESTIYVTLNYKNFQKNYSDVDLLVLKMGNTILSDSQLYKQAGNSICVGVLERILKNILHIKK